MTDETFAYEYELHDGRTVRVPEAPTRANGLRISVFETPDGSLRESTDVPHEALAKCLSWGDLTRLINAKR